MRPVPLIIHKDRLELLPYWVKVLNQAVIDAHKPLRGEITILTPESRKMRNFLHGAVYSLWAHLNGWDYRDSEVMKQVHIILATEFNGEVKVANGKTYKVPKSTRGKLKEYIERVIDSMVDQFGIDPAKVLNPAVYKKWRDEIAPFTDVDFVQYLIKLGELK